MWASTFNTTQVSLSQAFPSSNGMLSVFICHTMIFASSSPDAKYWPECDHLTTLTARWCLVKSETASASVAPFSRTFNNQIYKWGHQRKAQTFFNSILTSTWQSPPPEANLYTLLLRRGCRSTLNTGSRLCQEISGITHFILI